MFPFSVWPAIKCCGGGDEQRIINIEGKNERRKVRIPNHCPATARAMVRTNPTISRIMADVINLLDDATFLSNAAI